MASVGKTPVVRDRSDANPNLGVSTRSDLAQGYQTPAHAVVPGADTAEVAQTEGGIEPCSATYAGQSYGSIQDRTVGKAENAQGPVIARPQSGMLKAQPGNMTPAANKPSHADLTTNKLQTGPAIANPIGVPFGSVR
jgi:hypothetical protein